MGKHAQSSGRESIMISARSHFEMTGAGLSLAQLNKSVNAQPSFLSVKEENCRSLRQRINTSAM